MRAQSPAGRETGYSLIEMLVTLVVLVEIIVAALMLFDQSERVSRAQTHIAGMQQQNRVTQVELSRIIQAAGSGGLPEGMAPSFLGTVPLGVFPDGLAVAVRNNTAANLTIDNPATNGPGVVEGTDVLIVRGVFNTPLYYFDAVNLQGTQTTVNIPPISLQWEQDLAPLIEVLTKAQNEGRPEAFIVKDSMNPTAYAVVEFQGWGGDINGVQLTVEFDGAAHRDEYGNLTRGSELKLGAGGTTVAITGGNVQLPTSVSAIGVLEEYRFFLREKFEIPSANPMEPAGDPNSRPVPVFSRARFYPGTTTLHPDGAVDIADNIVDFQVAIGVDLDGDGRVDDGAESGTATDEDEILFNDPGDDSVDDPGDPDDDWAQENSFVHFLRVTTLAQTDRADRDYGAGLLVGMLEDHDLAPTVFGQAPHENFRRRMLQTIVDMRGLP